MHGQVINNSMSSHDIEEEGCNIDNVLKRIIPVSPAETSQENQSVASGAVPFRYGTSLCGTDMCTSPRRFFSTAKQSSLDNMQQSCPIWCWQLSHGISPPLEWQREEICSCIFSFPGFICPKIILACQEKKDQKGHCVWPTSAFYLPPGLGLFCQHIVSFVQRQYELVDGQHEFESRSPAIVSNSILSVVHRFVKSSQ